MSVIIQTDDFDPQAVVDDLCKGRLDIGALVTFVGLVRDTAKTGVVSAMELEHYPGMTEKSLQSIIDQAAQRWSLQGVRVIHRVGMLQAAERIVMVAVASSHRGVAFEACEFIMDYLKTRAPFWKKEYTAQGASWVDTRDSDNASLARWE